MGKLVYASLVLLLVGACNPPFGNPMAGFRPTEAERVRAGWYHNSTLALTPRYCYRTLARVDCFDRPRRGEAERQVGGFNELAQ